MWRRVKPSPKSLILDLLQSLRGRSMPVRALVEAGALVRAAGERRARRAGAAAGARAGRARRAGALPARRRRAADLAPGRRLVERGRSARCAGRRLDRRAHRTGSRRAIDPPPPRRARPRLPRLRAARSRLLSSDPTTCAAESPRARDELHELGLDPAARGARGEPSSTRRPRRARAGSGTAQRSCARSARRARRSSAAPRGCARLRARGGHGRDVPRRRARDPRRSRSTRACPTRSRPRPSAGRWSRRCASTTAQAARCWREFMRAHDAPHRARRRTSPVSRRGRAAALGTREEPDVSTPMTDWEDLELARRAVDRGAARAARRSTTCTAGCRSR